MQQKCILYLNYWSFFTIFCVFVFLTGCDFNSFTNMKLETEVLYASPQNVNYTESYNSILAVDGSVYTTKETGKKRSVVYRTTDGTETILLKGGWYCNLQIVNGWLYATDVDGPFTEPADTVCLNLKDGTKEVLENVQNYFVFSDNSILYYEAIEKKLLFRQADGSVTTVLNDEDDSWSWILAGEKDTVIIKDTENGSKVLYYFQNGRIQAKKYIPDAVYDCKYVNGELYLFEGGDELQDVTVYQENAEDFFASQLENWEQATELHLPDWNIYYNGYVVTNDRKQIITENNPDVICVPIENTTNSLFFVKKRTDTLLLFDGAIMINDTVIYDD